MKTKFTLTILLTVFTMTSFAQWVPAGSGMDNYVWASAVYNGNLYASGNFEHADGVEALAIAKWDGNTWSAVGGGFQHDAFTNIVDAMIVFNNELYAGGYVDSAGGNLIHKVAKWNGSVWSAVGTHCPISTVRCFAIHNGELYAGGSSSGAGNCAVAKWNGSTWDPLDVEGGTIEVWSLASYNGNLYAGGNMANINSVTVSKIAKWDGNVWSDVSGGLTNGFGTIVRALAVFNNKLFVGGNFNLAGATVVHHVASWDGTNWADVGGGVGGSTAIVQSFLPFGNKLFVGGTFWTVNGANANRAAYWDGTAWTVLGTDLSSGARTQQVYNSELYSMGEIAGSGQNYAAKWTGGTFTGIEEAVNHELIEAYPNPASDKVYVPVKRNSSELFLSDFSGRRVEVNFTTSTKNPDELEFDTSKLSPGFYFLNTTDHSAPACRIVVQH